MEMACPGAPGSTVGQQQEFAKAKEKTQAMGKKQSSVHKLEAVEKSPVFCGKWEILNDVITKGTAKDGSEAGPAAISIIAQAECQSPGLQAGVGGGERGGTAFGRGWLAIGRAGLRVPLWKREVRATTTGDTHKIGPGVKPGISVPWEPGQCQGGTRKKGEVADEALPMVTRAGEGSWEAGIHGLQGAGESAGSSGRPSAFSRDLGQPEHLWRGPDRKGQVSRKAALGH